METKSKINAKNYLSSVIKILGQHMMRYNLLMIIFLIAIILINVVMTLGWYFSPDDVAANKEIAFYINQSSLFFVSITMLVLLIIARFVKFKEIHLAILSHLYALAFIVSATFIFTFDLSLGFSPLMYLLIVTFIAGIFAIEPIFFVISVLLSLIPIIISIIYNPSIFFEGKYLGENIALFSIFIIITIIIVFRNYRVIHGEYLIQQKLQEISYKDELTGLLNERSYVNETENINSRIKKGEDLKFAVVLMDVNNLKATNDTYGHRYGCSLVVRCGHTLPTIFSSSKLFHVGGDEFVAIVYGKDYDNFTQIMKNFDEKMLYSIVNFDGQDLIFSVARGYHIRQEGQYFKDVLQIADKEMYSNKKYLKEKYNMKGR